MAKRKPKCVRPGVVEDWIQQAEPLLAAGDREGAFRALGIKISIYLRFLFTYGVTEKGSKRAVSRSEFEELINQDLQRLDPIKLARAFPRRADGHYPLSPLLALASYPMTFDWNPKQSIFLVAQGSPAGDLIVHVSSWNRMKALAGEWRGERVFAPTPLDDASAYGLDPEFVAKVDQSFGKVVVINVLAELSNYQEQARDLAPELRAQVMLAAVELSNRKIGRLKRALKAARRDPTTLLDPSKLPPGLGGTFRGVEVAEVSRSRRGGSPDELLRDLERRAAADPSDWPLRLRLAQELVRFGRTESAFEALDMHWILDLTTLPPLYSKGRRLTQEEIVRAVEQDLCCLHPALLGAHFPRVKAGYRLNTVRYLKEYPLREEQVESRRLCLLAISHRHEDRRVLLLSLDTRGTKGQVLPPETWRDSTEVSQLTSLLADHS